MKYECWYSEILKFCIYETWGEQFREISGEFICFSNDACFRGKWVKQGFDQTNTFAVCLRHPLTLHRSDQQWLKSEQIHGWSVSLLVILHILTWFGLLNKQYFDKSYFQAFFFFCQHLVEFDFLKGPHASGQWPDITCIVEGDVRLRHCNKKSQSNSWH